MKPFGDQIYAIQRIIVGFLFLQHGAQKLFGFPVEMPAGAPDVVVYVAGSIEFVGGLMIMVGLFTSWAAFLCSGQMAAAYWMAHGLNAPLPIQNHGELAVLYCFAFLYMAAKGSGIWSVDSVRAGGA